MARVRSHVSMYNSTALLAREQQAEPQKHTARIHRPTYIAQAKLFRLIGIFAFLLEQFFLKHNFFIIIFFFLLLHVLFLSHRPSALRKCSMIKAAVREALESTLIIEVQPSLTNSYNHFIVCSMFSKKRLLCVI